jgi:hypothetical protein
VLEQAVVMTKDVLMERLCALVPPPRKHLVTYHGILAPASGLRPQVVPRRAQEARGAGGCRHAAGDGADCEGAAPGAAGGAACDESAGNHCDDAFRRQQAERRVRERLRVPHGGGKRRSGRRRYAWADLLQGGRVLGAMGLSAAVPEQAGCRSPPSGDCAGDGDEVIAE